MLLNSKQKSYLRGLAHHQSISVTVGNAGLSSGVINEIKLTLNSHELIKIKLPSAPKEQNKALIQSICDKCGAQLVQLIGRNGVVYKAANPSVIEFP